MIGRADSKDASACGGREASLKHFFGTPCHTSTKCRGRRAERG